MCARLFMVLSRAVRFLSRHLTVIRQGTITNTPFVRPYVRPPQHEGRQHTLTPGISTGRHVCHNTWGPLTTLARIIMRLETTVTIIEGSSDSHSNFKLQKERVFQTSNRRTSRRFILGQIDQRTRQITRHHDRPPYGVHFRPRVSTSIFRQSEVISV